MERGCVCFVGEKQRKIRRHIGRYIYRWRAGEERRETHREGRRER